MYNFTQIEGNTWRVSHKKGGTFNALTDSYDQAVQMFLKWMWGGEKRPDKLSFNEWRRRNVFKFFLA